MYVYIINMCILYVYIINIIVYIYIHLCDDEATAMCINGSEVKTAGKEHIFIQNVTSVLCQKI